MIAVRNLTGSAKANVRSPLLLVVLLPAFRQAVLAESPVSQAIDQAIQDLGASEYAMRQAASGRLWHAGDVAEAALHVAAKNSDPDVHTRALELLNRLRLGMRAAMLAEELALIEQLHHGATRDQRQRALRQLQAQSQWLPIVAAIHAEPDSQIRRQLAAPLVSQTSKIVSTLHTESGPPIIARACASLFSVRSIDNSPNETSSIEK